MKKTVILLLALAYASGLYAANENFDVTPRIANVTETSFTVLYTTKQKTLSWVEIAPDDGTTWYQCERTRYYEDVSGRHFYGRYHHVTVSGLKPGTSYRYRVIGKTVTDDSDAYKMTYGPLFAWNPSWGTGNRHARSITVRTLDANAPSCSFSLVCDTHFDDAKLSSLINGMPEDNDFIVYAGDIISHSSNIDSVLIHTFMPVKEKVSQYPVFYARGNHESRGADWHKLPAEFPSNNGQFYYIFRQGPAAFLVLDAGEDKPDSNDEYFDTASFDKYRLQELEWLKTAVNDPSFTSAPQKICIIHIPTLAGKEAWYCQKWITDNFAPILAGAGVKLMLSGHHHRYIFHEAGQDGIGYNVYVNSNEERLDVKVTGSGIQLKSFDLKGVQTREMKF